MIPFLTKYYFKLQIKFLVVFRVSVLFERINQLDWYKETLQQWIDDQKFISKSKVLEVGCATGLLTTYIANSGLIPSGVDSSSEMIEMAKLKRKGIDFKVGNALELPYKAESFYAVVAASLINIISDKSKAVSELTRTCKVGGVVSVLVPSAGFSDKNLSSLQETLGVSGFSGAAMEAWHKMPPKMKDSDIYSLFEKSGLIEISKKYYLQGMVVSVSGRKALSVENS